MRLIGVGLRTWWPVIAFQGSGVEGGGVAVVFVDGFALNGFGLALWPTILTYNMR